jgi:hypothetical protein
MYFEIIIEVVQIVGKTILACQVLRISSMKKALGINGGGVRHGNSSGSFSAKHLLAMCRIKQIREKSSRNTNPKSIFQPQKHYYLFLGIKTADKPACYVPKYVLGIGI